MFNSPHPSCWNPCTVKIKMSPAKYYKFKYKVFISLISFSLSHYFSQDLNNLGTIYNFDLLRYEDNARFCFARKWCSISGRYHHLFYGWKLIKKSPSMPVLNGTQIRCRIARPSRDASLFWSTWKPRSFQLDNDKWSAENLQIWCWCGENENGHSLIISPN